MNLEAYLVLESVEESTGESLGKLGSRTTAAVSKARKGLFSSETGGDQGSRSEADGVDAGSTSSQFTAKPFGKYKDFFDGDHSQRRVVIGSVSCDTATKEGRDKLTRFLQGANIAIDTLERLDDSEARRKIEVYQTTRDQVESEFPVKDDRSPEQRLEIRQKLADYRFRYYRTQYHIYQLIPSELEGFGPSKRYGGYMRKTSSKAKKLLALIDKAFVSKAKQYLEAPKLKV